MLRQQPLREVGYGLPHAAGIGNRYGAIMQSCCGSGLTMPCRWQQSDVLEVP
jgi:hypothetical protein